MDIKQIAKALSDRRINIVAAETGLHVNTIRDIRDGKSKDPKHSTIEALVKYLEKE